MAKDFFDEEYEKKTQQENEQKQALDNWYSRPAPEQVSEKKHKPLYIVLTCFVLIACIGLGWLLCFLVDEVSTPEEEKILGTVIQYLKNNYYKDVDNWTDAIEYSGSALMYYAGDRFSQLMSPQTYYDFNFPTSSAVSNNEVFGLSMSINEGVGLYVSSVTADSNAYGKFLPGDIILRLSDIVGYDGVPKVKVNDGVVEFPQINLGEWASVTIKVVLEQVKSATFHVLRAEGEGNDVHYSIKEIPLERGVITPVSSKYNYTFIEFYFNNGVNEEYNISVPSTKDAQGNYVVRDDDDEYTTYEDRHLDKLLQLDKTGYVRIDQFMDYVEFSSRNEMVTISASQEFKMVMDLFKSMGLKHLVLDLKGNPGGNVAYVTEIAGMLTTTSSKLTPEEIKKVTNRNNELLITYLEMPKPATIRQNYYVASSYYNYFDAVTDTCDIVVWTDGNSASASELLTGTLLDYKMAVQMGTKTYGKGIAQTWEELPFKGKVKDRNGDTIDYPWAIYYTCAKYYPPLSDNIHDVGYTPKGEYNNLKNYNQLWDATIGYWNA